MSEFSRLLAAAKQGDTEALGRLYESYASPVLGAVRRRLKRPLRRWFDSADLSQSVFADVFRDLPRFEDLGEEAFRHWLFLRVQSKVATKYRRLFGQGGRRAPGPLRPDTPIPAPGRSPASEIEVVEERESARGLLAALDEEQRSLVLLRIEEDLTFEQIAARLGLPSGEAARKRYARCLARLHAQVPRAG